MKLRPHQINVDGLADGDYTLHVAGEVAELVPAGTDSTEVVPLTTVINGVPDLVWDNNNNLIFTEVPA